MSDKYRAASLTEMQIPPLPGQPTWSVVRHHLGVGAFGINAWTADEPGMEVIQEHDEVGEAGDGERHEEVYVVLSGRATFTVDGDEIDGPPGTFVFVQDPNARRKAVAAEPGTTVLAVGAQRGRAFEPSRWERSAPAFAYFATEEYDKAHEVLAGLHEEFPDDAGILYNLACAESMLGRNDEALAHLGTAVGKRERFRAAAQGDSDFDPVRDDARFKELVGASAAP
jgi:tetratricopeptide (TPR) repeat protein